MSKEKLEELRKKLLKEFTEIASDYLDSYKRVIEGERKRLLADIDARIKVLKDLPIDPFEYDFITTSEFKIEYDDYISCRGYDLGRLKRGIWKIIIMGKKIKEL